MINIWIIVLVAVIFALTEISVDTFLGLLKTILIVVFSILVSLRLHNLATTTLAVNAANSNPFKLGLLFFLSILILILPFIRIAQQVKTKRNRKATTLSPDENKKNGDLETIFAVLLGIFFTLSDIFPYLQNFWMSIILLLFFIFLWTFRFLGKKNEKEMAPKE